ncbi:MULTISPECIES: branched-chain amino acid transporter permease [Moraxella]|uniref:Branched-chain amino acid transporter permease n=2 Tax=Moraxella TaxID=475 RepID=A0AAQ2Q9W2_MORBO|nr:MULTISPECIES: branched-chain amino acid transporter permease [Moraxella]AWY20824.1 branched-chain amino acid ABC transporter [Moraxella bovis]MBE9579445.1 branched-chain amino acid transporter permease [Moraxella sp. K1664]MBE9588809.1 branched-chain amino acid transporter permease [Moraxella sp. K1630]MBE9590809.1 branched-chain amino acid transporter permease [Moraxella sp. K127]MBE9597020.1 branched-chain amino acid transporter permease [Moraxella sp. K2450]
MTLNEQLLTIATAIVAVQLCRWVAFWAFPAHKKVPDFVQYLGKALPSAVFGLLVVYCYKNVDILGQYHGMAEFIAGAVVVGLHLWRKNMFISIGVGTILYMILVQKVFV